MCRLWLLRAGTTICMGALLGQRSAGQSNMDTVTSEYLVQELRKASHTVYHYKTQLVRVKDDAKPVLFWHKGATERVSLLC